MMNYSFVYVLRSFQDGSFYIGYTKNLSQRLEYHNAGKVKYTKGKMPWKIVHYEKFERDSEARKREIQLKKSSWHKKQLFDKLKK